LLAFPSRLSPSSSSATFSGRARSKFRAARGKKVPLSPAEGVPRSLLPPLPAASPRQRDGNSRGIEMSERAREREGWSFLHPDILFALGSSGRPRSKEAHCVCYSWHCANETDLPAGERSEYGDKGKLKRFTTSSGGNGRSRAGGVEKFPQSLKNAL